MLNFLGVAARAVLVTWPLAILNTLVFRPAQFAIRILTLPLRAIFSFLWSSCAFVLAVLHSFEAIYVFLGCAVCVGIVTGLVLHLTSFNVIAVLHITVEDEQQAKQREQAAAQRRRARAQRASLEEAKALETRLLKQAPRVKTLPRLHGKTLAAQTILEETSEESDF